MDRKQKGKTPECGDLPDISRDSLAVGAKQLKKAVRAGKAARVYLAENADPALTQPLAELCGEYQIQITWVADMADLGRACGIEVGAAAAAVLKILPEDSVE